MKIKKHLSQLFLLILMLCFSYHSNAQALKTIAASKGKFIGNLMRDGFLENHQVNNGATDLIAKTEYNALVTGNKMKMSNLLSIRPVDPFNVKISDIKTADIDKFIAYANANGMRKRGHVMIWYKQIPQWLVIESPSWTAQQIYDFSSSYIIALSTYTAGKIDEWDVLNEAVADKEDTYRKDAWYAVVNSQANAAGKIGYLNYFSSLFKWARQGDPNVSLFYNDFNVEAIDSQKNNFMRKMVKDLKNDYNTPINGVGLQSHFILKDTDSTFIANVGKTIDDLGASGFTTNITELDIRICAGDGKTLQDQRIAYRDMVSTALSKSNCNTVLIWGMSDNDSWVPSTFLACGKATPHDDLFQKKPAYFGIQEALLSLFPVIHNESICSGSSYTWPVNGVTYTTAQTELKHTVGFTTHKLNLTITPATTTGIVTQTQCGGVYTWPVNNVTYSASTNQVVTSNCNTATLNLTITPVTTIGSTTQTQCGGVYTWPVNNVTYASSTTQVFTSNCNTATLNLTITPATSNGSISTAICEGETYVWPANGQTYTTAQTGLTHISGCNTATLNVAITQCEWNFNGTVHEFTANNFSQVTSGATFATYSINPGAIHTDLENLTANINTSKKYIAISLKNNTANTRVQLITNRVGLPALFTNFDGIIANDSGFTTYYINMSTNLGWTGILNQISFRFKLNSVNDNPAVGTILIDNIAIVSAIPSPLATAKTFCGATTVASLVATGTNLKWYAAPSGGTVLGSSDALVSTTYYVSQTSGNSESGRTPVSVSVLPTTTTGTVTTAICEGETYVWPANGQTYTTTQTGLTHVSGCNTATLNLMITKCEWNFNGTVHEFTATAFSKVTSGTTYATYSINPGAIHTDLENLTANIDTSKKYIAISLKNNTANTRVQLITNRVGLPALFTNFDGIIANDSGFTTYYINMSTNLGWTGILNQISFRFKLNSANDNPAIGTILIDNIAIVSAIPSPLATTQTFCGATTVASLVATGTNLKWYAAPSGGTVLGSSDALVSTTYYVSQTSGNSESGRTPVIVSVLPTTTTGTVTTAICEGETYVWPVNGQTYSTTQTGLTHISGCNTATLNLTITKCEWNFNGTVHEFTANSFSKVTSGATYATYSINPGAIHTNLENLTANIDTSKKYIAISLKNNTANTRVQLITNRVGLPALFTNFDGIIANDSGFTTYYINMSTNLGWTGILNQISFRFKLNSVNDNPAIGTILIDNIAIVSAIPNLLAGSQLSVGLANSFFDENRGKTSVSNVQEDLVVINNKKDNYISIKGLSAGNATFKIYTLLGQLVVSKKRMIYDNNLVPIEVANLNSGLYILDIEQFGKNVQKKLIR